MKRIVEPELLDELPPDDPCAVHSRRDLRRLNWCMRHLDIFCAAAALVPPPRSIAELGAGDGTLMLAIARRMHQRWPAVRVTLVDRQKTVAAETLARFGQFGWSAEAVIADVFDWLKATEPADLILANLFLHHFADAKLAELLRLVAARTDFFLAGETRRTWPSFAVGRLLWFLGCNAVTRSDAQVSMRAGFRDAELSALWPPGGGWQLQESGTVVFTHLFVAQRKGDGR
jgi:hypothetical protein